MAKVEELMALMIDEINRYEQLVKKMEKLQQNKLEIDVSKLENTFQIHQEKINEHEKSYEFFYHQMEALLKNAKIYPKWAVIVFIGSLAINFVGLILLIFARHYLMPT